METKIKAIFSAIHALLVSSSFKDEHRISPQSFIGQRTIGFSELILLQLNLLTKTVSVELENALHFFTPCLHYTKQACSQARQKLSYSAFVALNTELVKTYYSSAPFQLYRDKYILLAIDGSLIQLPQATVLTDFFSSWKNKTNKSMPMARCSIVYDLLNRIVLTSDLVSCNISEAHLYQAHLCVQKQCFKQLPPCLYIMDRNYPSLQKMIEIPLAANFYLIRCKAGFCTEVTHFVNSDQQQAFLISSKHYST